MKRQRNFPSQYFCSARVVCPHSSPVICDLGAQKVPFLEKTKDVTLQFPFQIEILHPFATLSLPSSQNHKFARKLNCLDKVAPAFDKKPYLCCSDAAKRERSSLGNFLESMGIHFVFMGQLDKQVMTMKNEYLDIDKIAMQQKQVQWRKLPLRT